MIIASKKEFWTGVGMSVGFLIVLAIMFSPVFSGKNAFEAADDFFNSIAKGSTNYMADLLKESESFLGRTVEVTMRFPNSEKAIIVGKLFKTAGLLVEVTGAQVRAAGDLAKLTQAAIKDSDAMFHNKGKELQDRYGVMEKQAMFSWWEAFKEMERDLKRQKKFEEASWLSTVSKKAIEVGYNFYGIEAKGAKGTVGQLAFSLLFYVSYTMWWGYGILFLCEGLGLRMKPGAKKEV